MKQGGKAHLWWHPSSCVTALSRQAHGWWQPPLPQQALSRSRSWPRAGAIWYPRAAEGGPWAAVPWQLARSLTPRSLQNKNRNPLHPPSTLCPHIWPLVLLSLLPCKPQSIAAQATASATADLSSPSLQGALPGHRPSHGSYLLQVLTAASCTSSLRCPDTGSVFVLPLPASLPSSSEALPSASFLSLLWRSHKAPDNETALTAAGHFCSRCLCSEQPPGSWSLCLSKARLGGALRNLT